MRLVANSFVAALILAAPAGCANRQLVRADDMSAEQHRREAAQEHAVAAREASRAGSADGGPGADPVGYDPGGEHRRAAEEAREHARQHAAAAQFLEQFEDEACAGVDRSGRAGCPLLGPLVQLVDVPGGVRATFVNRDRARTAVAQMRCHYAFARTRHFDETASCPLYMSGIEIRPALDPRSVEIVARDEKTVRLLRQRSRAQATFVGAR